MKSMDWASPIMWLEQKWMGCKGPQDTRYAWPAKVGAKPRIEAFDLRWGDREASQ
jgi:hypothetical protein